mmetsp:Transcript_16096/g.50240  ORF Transcript_16096/g.50240 Transcript_16096/m.50240 type:complete len:245 (+) Transcript_16096:54-788(+)
MSRRASCSCSWARRPGRGNKRTGGRRCIGRRGTAGSKSAAGSSHRAATPTRRRATARHRSIGRSGRATSTSAAGLSKAASPTRTLATPTAATRCSGRRSRMARTSPCAVGFRAPGATSRSATAMGTAPSTRRRSKGGAPFASGSSPRRGEGWASSTCAPTATETRPRAWRAPRGSRSLPTTWRSGSGSSRRRRQRWRSVGRVSSCVFEDTAKRLRRGQGAKRTPMTCACACILRMFQSSIIHNY